MVLFTNIALNVIVVCGLDILFGYSGQMSMGHAAFYAMGAYGSAILTKNYGLSPWITIILVSILTAFIAFLIALPITKLVRMFLSVATIAIGEIAYQCIVVIFADITRSTNGFPGIPKFHFGEIVFRERYQVLIIIFIFMVLSIILKQMIVKSKIGRAFIAIRENTVAAGGMGINVQFYKAAAFGISAFFAALAGALFAHFQGYISPETFKRPTSSGFITMVLLGGSGTLAGPLLGAVILGLFGEILQSFGTYQMLIYGLIIMGIILFAPSGLVGIMRNIKNFVLQLVAKVNKKGAANGLTGG
jgi:branched-chain amino acid transport system permease protein